MLVHTFDIAPVNAMMYYPETNVLAPTVADARSRTPSVKNTVVRMEVDRGG